MSLDFVVLNPPCFRPDETLIPLNKPYNPNFGQGGFKIPGAPARTPNPYAQATGGRTPGRGGGGRTPNPYLNGDGRNPAANASSSRTPNPYGDGGKTPAWNPSSRTPNPHQDAPAWNASSRTPNPYQDASKTAGWSASSRTPNPYANSESPSRGNDGGRTPSGWGTGGWGSGSSDENTWGTSPARPADASYSSSWVSTVESHTSTAAHSLDDSLHRRQQLPQHRLLLRPRLRRTQVRPRLAPWGRQVSCTQPRPRGSRLRTRTTPVSDPLVNQKRRLT
jgi:hypothetical protein